MRPVALLHFIIKGFNGCIVLVNLKLEEFHVVSDLSGHVVVLDRVVAYAVTLNGNIREFPNQHLSGVAEGEPCGVSPSVVKDVAVELVGNGESSLSKKAEFHDKLISLLGDLLGKLMVGFSERVQVGEDQPEVLASVVVEVCLEWVLGVVAHEDALGDAGHKGHVVGKVVRVAPVSGAILGKRVEVVSPVAAGRSELLVIDEGTLEAGVSINRLEINADNSVDGCLVTDEVCEVVAHDLLDELFGDGHMNPRDVVGENTADTGDVSLLNTINHPAEMDGSGGRRGRGEGREVADRGHCFCGWCCCLDKTRNSLRITRFVCLLRDDTIKNKKKYFNFLSFRPKKLKPYI